MTWYTVIEYPLRNNYRDLWSGKADIVRNDTGEIVETARIILADGEDNAASLLKSEVARKLDEIELPVDWGNPDPVRMIFRRWDIFFREKAELHQRIYEEKSKDAIALMNRKIENLIVDNIIYIQNEYEKLSDIDKKRLLGGDNEELSNCKILMERLNARNFLMKIIPRKSDDIIAVYRSMRDRIRTLQAGK